MLKVAFQNYARNLKWFLYVLLITGASLAIFYGIFMLGIMLPIKNADPAVHANVLTYINDYFASLRVTDMMSADFLQVFIKGLQDEMAPLKFSLRTSMVIQLIAGGLIIMVATKLSKSLARRALRKTVKTKYTKKGIRAMVVKQIVSLGFTVLYTFLTYTWFYMLFLLPLVSVVLNSFQNLYLTWYIHYKEFEKKKLFNFANGMRLSSVNLVLNYANLAVVMLFSFINIMLAAAIAVPLFTYNACVADITARGYFKHLIEGGELVSPKPEKKKLFAKKKETKQLAAGVAADDISQKKDTEKKTFKLKKGNK